ncbi:prolyl oligopeptidase family serine peptidase [Formosa algae]|uniref:prolyl oligopeptidase family serine peptidase n=1 Tax=Formosa algae TaxID=225843 RepID=UPI000CCEBF49|nr:prolyl oligopeptidase family serine peptidase [Formosa algae]PNW28444.1 esterase [Formosa algae]
MYTVQKNIKQAVLMLVVFVVQAALYSQNKTEKEILATFKNTEEIVYKTVDGEALSMLVFYPEAQKMKAKNPWMMYVHGGGWAGGSKYNILKKAYLETLKSLLDQGIICVTIDYRLAKGNSNAFDAVVDAKDAARFLLKNAKAYKLDKINYGVWGGSAGGHLSLVTALGENKDFKGEANLSKYTPKFNCVVSYFPFTSCVNPDLRPGSIFEDKTLFLRVLGAPLEEKPELAKLLSPTELLNKKSPPILLIHGDKDSVLPIINSTYMLDVAKDKNADVDLLTIKNAAHSFNGKNLEPTITELNNSATQFILTHLKK